MCVAITYIYYCDVFLCHQEELVVLEVTEEEQVVQDEAVLTTTEVVEDEIEETIHKTVRSRVGGFR